MNYSILGSDRYRCRLELTKIIQSYKDKLDEFDTVTMDASSSDFKMIHLYDEMNIIPFFNEIKLIIVKNPSFLTSTGSLSDHDSKLFETILEEGIHNVIVVFYGSIVVDKRKKIVKLLQKHSQSIDCDCLDEAAFQVWVKRAFNSKKITLTNDAMNELFSRLPLSLEVFENELTKLECYSSSLTKEDICHLVPKLLDEDVFLLVNAACSKRLKDAMHYWQDLAVLNKDPIYLVALLASQFRFMYHVKLCMESNMSREQIISTLKAHPYRVKKTMDSLFGVSLSWLLSILNDLATLDQNFKSGIGDKKLSFELFIINTAR